MFVRALINLPVLAEQRGRLRDICRRLSAPDGMEPGVWNRVEEK
jgi:hypothetical protein